MPDFHAHASAPIAAPAERVYQILTDYHVEHPAIVPRPPFTTVEVLEGGRGAGTVIDVGMRVFGTEKRVRGVVSEPEPDRIIAETYDDPTVGITTFTIDRKEGGCHLTIATRGRTSHGSLLGRIEELFIGWFLGRTYANELRLIEARAKAQPPKMPE